MESLAQKLKLNDVLQLVVSIECIYQGIAWCSTYQIKAL